MEFFNHAEMQELAKESLKKYGQKLPYDFWVIDQKDNFEQFGFFFTNNGEEDPIVFNCFPAYVEEGDSLYEEVPQGKFSKLIEAHIEVYESALRNQ